MSPLAPSSPGLYVLLSPHRSPSWECVTLFHGLRLLPRLGSLPRLPTPRPPASCSLSPNAHQPTLCPKGGHLIISLDPVLSHSSHGHRPKSPRHSLGQDTQEEPSQAGQTRGPPEAPAATPSTSPESPCRKAPKRLADKCLMSQPVALTVTHNRTRRAWGNEHVMVPMGPRPWHQTEPRDILEHGLPGEKKPFWLPAPMLPDRSRGGRRGPETLQAQGCESATRDNVALSPSSCKSM